MAVDVAAEAEPFVARAAAGPGLGDRRRTLIAYGLAVCATALDQEVIAATTATARGAGADDALLVKVAMLVSAVGVHALHEAVIALRRDDPPPVTSPYWDRFDAELPGFRGPLAAVAPWADEAFRAFAGAAVAHGRLDRLTRELIWVSVDASPTHQYVPGLRFHLDCAVRSGATRSQLDQTLALAAAGPVHRGVGRHHEAQGT